MSQYYTVGYAQQLEGTDNYGNVTYSVKFAEETDSALWKMNPQKSSEPKNGDKVYGHIETPMSRSGKPYRKFVKDNPDEGEGGSQAFTAPSGPRAGSAGRSFTKDSADRSDGMRQGMCINNAAAYINASKAGSIVDTPEDWAKGVHAYASALYALGDLTVLPSESFLQEKTPTPTGPTGDWSGDQGLNQPADQPMPKDFGVKQDEVVDVPDGPVDMSMIDDMFATTEKPKANQFDGR